MERVLKWTVFVLMQVGFVNAQSHIDLLLGNWQKSENGKLTIEFWRKNTENMYDGIGAEINKSDTLFQENLKLIKLNYSWVYIAELKSQNPVLFTLVESSNKQLVFENKEHDFPQKITYTFSDSTTVSIRVEGRKKGKAVSDAYNLKKTN